MPTEPPDSPQGAIFLIRAEDLVVGAGFNIRDFSSPEMIERVERMAESVAEYGVLIPILVQPGGPPWTVVAGEIRVRGAKLAIERGANVPPISAIVDARFSENELDRLVRFLNASSQEPGALPPARLGPLEQSALALRMRRDHDLSLEAIAVALRVVPRYVESLLALAVADPRIKDHIRAGSLAATTAMKALHDPNPVELIERAIAIAASRGRARATPQHLREARARSAPGVQEPQLNAGVLIAALDTISRTSFDSNARTIAREALRAAGGPSASSSTSPESEPTS